MYTFNKEGKQVCRMIIPCDIARECIDALVAEGLVDEWSIDDAPGFNWTLCYTLV